MKCQRENCSNRNHTATPFCEKHAAEWRRQRGRTWVPIGPTRAHVQLLRDAGLGWYRIARLAGVSGWVVRNVIQADQKHVRISTAKNLLSVPIPQHIHDMASDGAVVSGVGTRRRLRALVALGYSNERLAEEVGYPASQFGRLLGGEFDVTASLARKAERAFDRLQMLRPPDGYAVNRSRLRAARRGWFPPLAWDLDSIDDPAARPRGVSQSRDGWFPEYEKLLAKGLSKGKIAALMGIEETSLNSRLRRTKAA